MSVWYLSNFMQLRFQYASIAMLVDREVKGQDHGEISINGMEVVDYYPFPDFEPKVPKSVRELFAERCAQYTRGVEITLKPSQGFDPRCSQHLIRDSIFRVRPRKLWALNLERATVLFLEKSQQNHLRSFRYVLRRF